MGGFAIGARVALLWQHNANPSYKLASIPRYDDIVRTAGWAGSDRRRGRSQHYCGSLTAGFHWWRFDNKKRTQNVSEYMLVLALCLVDRCTSTYSRRRAHWPRSICTASSRKGGKFTMYRRICSGSLRKFKRLFFWCIFYLFPKSHENPPVIVLHIQLLRNKQTN